MIRKARIIVIAMLLPTAAFGADEWQNCLEKPEGQTTFGMKACNAAEYDRLRPAIKSAYESEIARDAKNGNRLAAAQQAWEKFSLQACTYEYARGQNGSISGVLSTGCLVEKARQRADQLGPSGMEKMSRYNPGTTEYKKCSTDATKLGACLSAALQRSDELLNDAYRKRLAAASQNDKWIGKDNAGEQPSLVVAERAWIAFRDAQCGYLAAKQGGPNAKPTDLRCRLVMTEDRTRDLSSDP